MANTIDYTYIILYNIVYTASINGKSVDQFFDQPSAALYNAIIIFSASCLRVGNTVLHLNFYFIHIGNIYCSSNANVYS